MAILDCSHSLHFYFLITLIHIRITQPFSMSVLCSRTSGPFTSSHSSFNGSFLYPYFWGNTRVHLILTFKWMDFWGLLVITFACYCCHCSSSSPPPLFPFYLCPSSSLCSQTNTNFHKSQKLPVIFRQISTGNLAMVIVLRMQEWYCLQAIKPNFEV